MNPFDQLHRRDGFFVSQVMLGDSLSLHVGVNLKDELQAFRYVDPSGNSDTKEIWAVDKKTEFDLGRTDRVRLLAEAFCRYFNCGGTWEEINPVIDRLVDFVPHGIRLPDWELLAAGLVPAITEDYALVRLVTVWANVEQNEVVEWIEGESITTGLPFEGWVDNVTNKPIGDPDAWQPGAVSQLSDPDYSRFEEVPRQLSYAEVREYTPP